ncbi:MAG: glycoside hydrolase family 3 C-terminal domain-containing protein [Phycisphaerae bacterium]
MTSRSARVAWMVSAVLAAASVTFGQGAGTPDTPAMPFRNAKLPVEQRVADLLQRLTLDEKILLLGGTGFTTQPIPRLGIPAFVMSDGPVGARNAGQSTAYPAGIGLAASFDIDNARRIGKAIGRDCRARGVHILLGPGMNIDRSPLCGRNFEYLGEDPVLDGELAAGYVEGMQSVGVSSTIKHFAGNEQEFDRHNLDTKADERTLREIYLRPFEICIERAHPWCLMTSYNPLNGVHASQNGWLLNDVLKGDGPGGWKFPGLVMSDWTSCYDTLGMANGGLDLEMPKAVFYKSEKLKPLIESGKVSEATLDDKVRRLFRVAISMGWIDRPQKDESIQWDDPANNKVALQGARESLVLLKNDNGFLPLDRSTVKSIVLVGPCADPAIVSGGGSGAVNAFHPVSILQGFVDKAGKDLKVTRVPWSPPGLGDAMVKREPSSGTWKAEYFANQNLEGTPAVTRQEKSIEFKLKRNSGPVEGVSHDHFSVRWTGTVRVEKSGPWVFGAASDDGSRVFVDGQKVIDDWSGHAVRDRTATVNLQAGKDYPVVVEYYNGTQDAAMRFGWGPPQEVLPAEYDDVIRNADAVFACVGFNDKTGASVQYEGEGSDRPYALPAVQLDLMQKVFALNPKTGVILTTGGAVDVTGWLDNARSLMMTWYAGSNGGEAVAEAVFGDVNPSGRLPFTWEHSWEEYPAYGNYPTKESGRVNTYKEGVFLGYRREKLESKPPLFAFGSGLSYTAFDVGIAGTPSVKDGVVHLQVNVKNTGTRAGAEVVQVYASPEEESGVERPSRALVGFARVEVAPGETKSAGVDCPVSYFGYWDDKSHAWKGLDGTYRLYAGRSSLELGQGVEVALK